MKMKKPAAAALAAVLALSLTACGAPEESKSAGTSQTDSKTEKRVSMFEFLPPIDKPNSEDEFICEVDGVGVKVTGTTAQGTALWIPDKIYDKPVIGVNLPNANFEEIIMPDTVQIFSINTAKVKYMNLPRNVQYDENAFKKFEEGYDAPEDTNTNVLESLYVDDGMSELMFRIGAESLQRVSLPDTLTAIGGYTFMGCTGLTNLVIPESVKKIEKQAFDGCENISINYGGIVFTYDELSDLSLECTCDENGTAHTYIKTSLNYTDSGLPERKVEEIYDEDIITYCSRRAETITIPSNITYIDWQDFNKCDKLQSIEVDPENETYYSKDGVLFQKEGFHREMDLLLAYPNAKPDKSYTIPDNVAVTPGPPNSFFGGDPTLIGIFSKCIYLQSLEVSTENELYTSEDGALYQKSKKYPNQRYLIEFPGGKTEYTLPNDDSLSFSLELYNLYGITALRDARNLEKINVSENSNKFYSDDGVLYSKDTNYLYVYPLEKTDTEYTLPDYIETGRAEYMIPDSNMLSNPYLITIIYKGKSYTRAHIDDLYAAINGS